MTIKRNRGGFRLLSPLVFALLSAIPAKSTFAGSGTIDPSNFAPGQDVSNAIPGVVLSTLTLTPTSPGNFAAVLSPVYIGTEDYILPSTGSVFSPSPTNNFWGIPLTGTGVEPPPFGQNCLNGCSHELGLAGDTYLEVSFATPVSSVSVTEFANPENSAGFQAFNSAGQIIENCTQFVGNCYSPNAPPPFDTGGIFTFSATGDISYILATSYDGGAGSEIGEITYVPLPDNFWMLLVGLGGLGCCLLRRRVAIASARPLLT
jgi:hypothetical protein